MVTEDIAEVNIDNGEIDPDYEPIEEKSSSEDDVSVNVPRQRKAGLGEKEDNTQTIEAEVKKCRFSRARKREKCVNRNRGVSYTTLSGKVVKARVMKPLRDCRAECRKRLPEDIRESIFKEYWSLGSRDRRVAYVASLVDTMETKTSRKRAYNPDKEKFRMVTHTFHFKINGKREKVCRGCFMNTLDETQMFVTLAITNRSTSTSGITQQDNRGKTSPGNAISDERLDEVRRHIQSFPSYESHYTRRTNNKKYLPSFLDLNTMFSFYKESTSNPVGRTVYTREFKSLGLAFKAPKVDTCHRCDTLQMKVKLASGAEEEDIKQEISVHHAEADKAYLQKDLDKKTAKDDPSKRCFTFDLQQCLPTPFVQSSVSFYKRQLWTYNLTMHETSKPSVRCYMWHEGEGARGANQVATCVLRELSELPEDVTHIILYSDTCGGQNRNSHVAAMFLYLMQQKCNLQLVDHKFMVSGHSHMECDTDHALIEKQKKKLRFTVSHPHDWYQLVRTVGRKNKFEVVELNHQDFLNFAELYKTSLFLRKKDSSGEPFKWTEMRWLRYTQERRVIQFKNTLDEDAPFREICLKRRNRSPDELLHPKKCYNSTLAISKEKKKDLLELLPLIDTVFHSFYLNLKTTVDARDVLPDIEEFNE
ncbi:uncharacterized protein LOC134542596 [Bacillus rossius redtenbacheri]|uniref:uncharacterized protein LOC134527679 n=1 Tax=Bacillus rossius redtenbacheri TaxID=93214 RepID=UPI002FDE6696